MIVIQEAMSGLRRCSSQSKRSRPSTNFNPDLASSCCVETWFTLCLVRQFSDLDSINYFAHKVGFFSCIETHKLLFKILLNVLSLKG